LREAFEGLLAAFDGAIYLDDSVSLRSRGEHHSHGQAGLVALRAGRFVEVGSIGGFLRESGHGEILGELCPEQLNDRFSIGAVMRKLVISLLFAATAASLAPSPAQARPRMVCSRVWVRGHLVRRCRPLPPPRHHHHHRPPPHRPVPYHR
jgi:hypothetical protein